MASPLVPRSHSRASFYSATTTYHSFQDIELYEPGFQSEGTSATTSARGPRVSQLKEAPVRRSRPSSGGHESNRHHQQLQQQQQPNSRLPSPFRMVRQDSGYESSSPHHKSSSSSSSKYHPHHRGSSTTRTSVSPPRVRQRPPLRRSGNSTKPGSSGPISHMPARSSLTMTRPTSLSSNLNRKHSYFQFPSPDNLDGPDHPPSSSSARPSVDLAPVILKVNTANANAASSSSGDDDDEEELGQLLVPPPPPPPPQQQPQAPTSSSDPHHHHTPSPPPPPPQTTHYWTSDRTRRLEYAAIDAASRGVRGWAMRHVVPDCFVSRESRRLGFDDDGGSVRRYRLDLEIECPDDSVPPSPAGEKKRPRGFRARDGRKPGWWARLRGCTT